MHHFETCTINNIGIGNKTWLITQMRDFDETFLVRETHPTI